MSRSTKHRHLLTTLLLATAVATTHVGCAGDIDAEQSPDDSEKVESATYGLTLDDESTVVASFDAPDGRQLKFVEPEPGFLLTITAGRVGSVPLVSSEEARTVKPDQLYERVSARKAPSRLREIAQRFHARSVPERPKPPTQAEKNIGERSQALHNFSDSWLFNGSTGTMACLFGSIVHRHALAARDLIHNDTVNGGTSTVYNTGVEANVTGSVKYRNTFTWSSPWNYNLSPNFFVNVDIGNDGWNVNYDIKTYVKPNGSSYTACQHRYTP